VRRTFRSGEDGEDGDLTLDTLNTDSILEIATRVGDIETLNSLCKTNKSLKEFCENEEIKSEINSYVACVKKRYDRQSRTTGKHEKGKKTWKEHFEYWEKLKLDRKQLINALTEILESDNVGRHEHKTYGPIGSWNVSGIQDMSDLFKSKGKFNVSLTDWDVSNVTNMEGMFFGASEFDNNGEEMIWNVENVTNMGSMFFLAKKFNRDIGSWNVINVDNMKGMFFGASEFDNNGKEMIWNVKNVTKMDRMFFMAGRFNRDIGSWDVSKVNNMDGMFFGASAFNNNGEEMYWDFSAVKSRLEMFSMATVYQRDIR
jgi:surface protein